jgi:predicted phage replisome organizer
MAEVKWVKLTTDMFDNRKIKHLRRLPEGNNIVLIWVMLLTMAGRCNSGGMIFLTENIPYTPKMLADELDFEENTVILALQVLEQLDMVVTDNGFFAIAGWEEYQNIEGLDKIREQTRKRVAKCREKKLLPQGNVTSNATVTECNGTDIEVDKEKEKEKDIDLFTTTTTEAAPMLTEVYFYFRSCLDEGYISEAEKFHAYNAKRGWDCLPNWKATADLWIARIEEKG